MAVTKFVLFAALLPAVLASPQHGSMYHGPHRANKPSGGWPHPTGPFQSSQASHPSSGGAPFPAGNSTAAAATTGRVTIKSTVTLIPVPLTSSVVVAGPSSVTTGAAGIGAPVQSGSLGSPSGVPGGPGQAGNVCGPATVTVTTANTVTVTVQASPNPSPIQTPQSSAPTQPSVGPLPLSSSSVPAPSPSSSSLAKTSTSPAPVKEALKGPVVAPAAPVEAGTTATTTPLVAVKADYHQPAAAANPVVKPPPVAPAPASSHPVAPVVPSTVPSPVSIAPSAPASSPSSGSGSSGSSNGVKGRGLLYSYNNAQLSPADSLAQANAAVGGAVTWMANWDSSPQTGSGPASGSTKVEYVAQLLGTDSNHLNAWKTNANTPWLLNLNEPDNCGGGGCCLSYQQAAEAHTAHVAPLRTGSTKVTTPCTQNNVGSPGIGSEYMANFLAQFPPNSFDAICHHWYGPGTQEGLNGSDNPQSLAATVAAYQKLQKQYGIAELWISEGGPEDASPDMIKSFLDWLDDPANGVDRYSWNGLNSPTSVVPVGAGSIYMSS